MKVSQLKIGVVLSYVITVLNMLIHLIYTPVMIRILGQSEYGLYTLVGSVVSYLSLFSLGFSGAYLRFYFRYASKKDEEGVARLNGMFLMLFMVMGMASLVCGMVLSCFTEQLFGTNLTALELKKAEILMRILVVNIALTFPSSVMDSIISSQEKFLFQRIISLAGIICNPFIGLPLLLYGYGSVALVVVSTAITFGKFLINSWYCTRKLHTKFEFAHFNWSLLKEMAGFSFFIFLNMIIDQINWSVDKFILGRVSGTASVAVYGVGAQINSVYVGFSSSISSVFSPRVNRIATNKENMCDSFTNLFIKVGRIQLLILALITSGFVIFGEYFVVELYATPKYKDAYMVGILLMLPGIIPLIQNIGLEIQRAVNKHYVRSVIYFFMALVNLMISIPLAKAFGAIGCAIGTAGSLLIANGFIMNVYYHRAIGIDIIAFWKAIASLCKGMIIPIIVGYLIMRYITFCNVFSFALWIVIYICIYVTSFWCFGMNAYEKDLVRKPLNKVLGRE